MELSVELVLGFLGTVGALITLGSKAVEAYRARAEAGASYHISFAMTYRSAA